LAENGRLWLLRAEARISRISRPLAAAVRWNYVLQVGSRSEGQEAGEPRIFTTIGWGSK
jgi:hypothetical protein